MCPSEHNAQKVSFRTQYSKSVLPNTILKKCPSKHDAMCPLWQYRLIQSKIRYIFYDRYQVEKKYLSCSEKCPSKHNAMCPSEHNAQKVSFRTQYSKSVLPNTILKKCPSKHDAMCPLWQYRLIQKKIRYIFYDRYQVEIALKPMRGGKKDILISSFI